jgi:hypothetical protein
LRPVSDAFLAAVAGSHIAAFRATLITGYQEGTSPTGTEIPVVGGDVTLDATADVRGTLELITDGTGWDPRAGKSDIQCYGTEVYVERGIVVGGSVTWVGQGYYKIQSVEQPQAPDGNLTVEASDRMQAIIDAQLPSPRSYAATDTVEDVVSDLVLELYPDATVDYDYDASSDELGSPQVTDTDRHGFLADLITTRGKVMYWDYQGHLVIQDPPDPGAPVYTVGAGKNGILIAADRTITREGVYNAVVVTADGSGTSDAPLAVAFDSNPLSPTYFYGPYGQVPQLFSSPLVKDYDSAAATAVLLLTQAITLPQTATLAALTNPALEPLDVLRVEYGSRSSPDISMTIDQLTIPLNVSDQWSAIVHDPSPTMRIGLS